MAYDPTTDIGKVRRKIVDTLEPFVFSDAEVQAALDQHDDIIGYAAADLLESRATVMLLTGGNVKILDSQVSVTEAAKALRDIAKAYRDEEDDWGGLVFGEMTASIFNQQQAILHSLMREAV